MGLMGLLFKIVVECFHVLAWPVFALGYPLCASIQAVETNSKSDTKKLITYWVCFSLILLFEHWFLNLLERLPSWPYIKLTTVCCLIVPHFDGSFYVYEHLVHPCLSFNPLIVHNWFIKMKVFFNQDNLLVDSMSEAKETGPDAIEDLLAFGSPTAFNVRQIKPGFTLSGNRMCASVEMKEMADATIAGADLVDILPSEKIQKSWTSDGCQETITSETRPVLHFQGTQQEGACHKLKANNPTSNGKTLTSVVTSATLGSIETGPAPDKQHSKDGQMMWTRSVCQETATNVTDFISPLRGKQHMDACDKLKDKEQAMKSNFPFASASFSAPPDSSCDPPEKLQSSSSQTPWTCAVCQVTATSKTDLISHFQGRRHKDGLEMLKVKIETSRSNIVVEEMAGSNLPDKQQSTSVQIPWTCGICQATIKGEASLVSHLQGRRHENACKNVKALIEKSKRDVSPASLGKKSNSSEAVGKYKTSNVSSPKTKRSNTKIQGKKENINSIVVKVTNTLWRCTICNIRCSSEGTMENHLGGRKHLAKSKKLIGAGDIETV